MPLLSFDEESFEVVDCSLLRRIVDIDGSCRGRPQVRNAMNASRVYRHKSIRTSKENTCLTTAKSAATNSLPTKKRRAVTFPLENTQIHYIDSDHTELSNELFYTKDDLQDMKRSAKRLCRSAGDTCALAEAYDSYGGCNLSNDETIVESVRASPHCIV